MDIYCGKQIGNNGKSLVDFTVKKASPRSQAEDGTLGIRG